ncbi:hypothetical protein EDD18DRAFT_1377840 [Armillaria luteobubalina]|uniref:Uncharacterized protein n=1 Tax=Armillaria luteobubalina TaxID=153913 RepID=A0AA39P5M6_9AGAR|nr:hypothetical protein EDD18DRAFT_1377840 [Armillaria luteobubalina]
MGRLRTEPAAIPRKKTSNRSQALENCRRDLAHSLVVNSFNSSSSFSDSSSSSSDSSSLNSSVDVSHIDFSAPIGDTEIIFHRNRKTTELQTAILKRLLPDYHHHSANGNLPAFRMRVNSQWATRFPENIRRYFLDRDECIRLIPHKLLGIKNSPPDAAYPRMSGGVLDFGPDIPCYDRCPVVNQEDISDYKDVLNLLLRFLRERRNQLKNWFNNNRCTRIIPRIGSGARARQIKVVPSRISRAIDLFSRKHYRKRVYPYVVEEAAQRGLPVNDISLVCNMTAHIWDNEIPEIKADIATCVDKERELIRAFKTGTLKSSDLTDDGKVMVIDSLHQQFGNMVKGLVEHLQWGVTILAGGVDPRTGRIRTAGYNYGSTVVGGKDFITSFNDAAQAGYIPGTNEGESRDFSQYYGLPFMHHMKKVHYDTESRNGPPPTAEQNAYIANPADVDPATLVTDDASSSNQAPVEANASVPLPPAYPLVPSDMTPSMFAPYNISSHPLPVTALTPPSVSTPLSATTAPHLQRMPSISPQPGAVYSAVQSIEPQSSFLSETLMDTGSDNPDASSWAHSYSGDSVITSSTLSGIDDALVQSGANVAGSAKMDTSGQDVDMISQSLDFSHLGWETQMSDSIKDDNLARIMEALGLSDIFVSDTATNSESLSTITESSSAIRASSDSQSQSFDQPTLDIVMDNSEAAAGCHMTPKSDFPSAPFLPPSLPDIAHLPRQPRQRRAPPPREVTTLCGAAQEQGPPQWHRDSLTALQDHSLGSGWISLVEKWYELESGMWKTKGDTEGKYPLVKQRPQELNEWLDGSRQFGAGLFISDPSRYGVQLIDWWNHLNPAWRRSKTGLPQSDYSKSLKCLRKGGRQGIVTIIFGLFWWGHACHGTEQLWQRMVEDVSKTIDVLI